jgi:hypothetical protein
VPALSSEASVTGQPAEQRGNKSTNDPIEHISAERT